jgi:hypothetical protein
LRASSIIADVLGNCSNEKGWFLTDQPELFAETVQVVLTNVTTINQNTSLSWLIEAHYQLNDCGFSTSGMSNQGNLLSLHFERKILKDHFFTLGIAETDILELDSSFKVSRIDTSTFNTQLVFTF